MATHPELFITSLQRLQLRQGCREGCRHPIYVPRLARKIVLLARRESELVSAVMWCQAAFPQVEDKTQFLSS